MSITSETKTRYDYILYTLPASMYSGKVRWYMNYKKLNYVDKPLNAYDLAIKIKPKTGEIVMPAVATNEGEWLPDTTLIIKELENRHANCPIVVETPLQYAVSMLLIGK